MEAGIAANDVAAARTAAQELAQGDARAGLAQLRESETMWQELEAPYEAARTRVLLGRPCGELGDQTEAEMNLAAAAAVFERLGAASDLGLRV